MTENKMAEVAKLFGKKLGEKFKIRNSQGKIDDSFYSFESCGLMWWNAGIHGNSLIFMNATLCDLLAHRAEIINIRWENKEGEITNDGLQCTGYQ